LIKNIASKPPTISWGISKATPISANISGISIPPLNFFSNADLLSTYVALILQSFFAFVIKEGLKSFTQRIILQVSAVFTEKNCRLLIDNKLKSSVYTYCKGGR